MSEDQSFHLPQTHRDYYKMPNLSNINHTNTTDNEHYYLGDSNGDNILVVATAGGIQKA